MHGTTEAECTGALRTDGMALIYVSASSTETVERVKELLVGHYDVSVRREPRQTQDGLVEMELYALTTTPPGAGREDLLTP
ncbi:hypothetical protein PV726_32275 [Streptomyces europaeiscabiei]|uniref:hypothetical protein n=1 Tax=Streptomyces europaeiscabiei TaxID=146819 RepID=UPI0029B0E956|nr:hypothetical protein [Streptomyces europaeiscabiei]MDX3694934.1 hypothetical protein [Streptomyces europaeiscabiei]